MQPAKKSQPLPRSSAPLPSSKSQKSYQKSKGIEKPNRTREDLKLHKTTSTPKPEKKGIKNRGSQIVDQSQVQKAFGVHQRNMIDYSQCQLSLKLLGCLNGQEAEIAKFKSIWKEKAQDKIDFTQFQDIYHKILSKEHQQITRQLFNLLSKQSSTIELSGLKEMAQSVGWTGNIEDIFRQIGSNSSISYEQFARIINIHFALF